MQRILSEAPIWDRDGDWLAVRAATAKLLEVSLILLPYDTLNDYITCLPNNTGDAICELLYH